MPDSIKAISPVSHAASAHEHATAHMVWPVGDGKTKHHAPPPRKMNDHQAEPHHHDGDEPQDPAIHHIDIMA